MRRTVSVDVRGLRARADQAARSYERILILRDRLDERMFHGPQGSAWLREVWACGADARRAVRLLDRLVLDLSARERGDGLAVLSAREHRRMTRSLRELGPLVDRLGALLDGLDALV